MKHSTGGGTVALLVILGALVALLGIAWDLGLVVGVVFLVLRLTDLITWGWALVLTPFIVAVGAKILIWVLGIIEGILGSSDDDLDIDDIDI